MYRYDRTLVWLILGLSCIGLVMVTSSSVFFGMKLSSDPLYFLKREIIYCSLTILLSLCVLYLPVAIWQRISVFLLLLVIAILFLVLVFDSSINGASRWIVWGFFHIQPSELSKLIFFFYFSNYLDKISGKSICFSDVYQPIAVTIILIILLLMQPDFGSVIIFICTVLSILFIFGMVWWKFLLLFVFVALCIFLLIFEHSYRMYRVISFWNPWNDPFGSGYQLIQSLVAFGRGGFLGTGLGNSIQKFEYLPEAYSDFIFSVLAEEIGFCGVLLVLFMMIFVVFRGMLISYMAFKMQCMFSGFLASAISFCFAFQTLVHIGTVTGVLPTKGSTLPFISYGGSSFFMVFVSVVFLLRIDFELRCIHDQAFMRGFFK